MPGLIASTAAVLLGATLTGPTTPVASLPDPCDSSNRFTDLHIIGTVIATDGVVRLHATRRYSPPESTDATLPFIEVEVLDPMGMPVDGAIEYQPQVNTIVWRPTLPLDPLTDYSVDVFIDNDALALALDFEGIAGDSTCGENLQDNAELLTSEGGLAPLSAPEPISESDHQVNPHETLQSMVCCDGAYPVQMVNTLDWESTIEWAEGYCASAQAHGEVRATEGFSDTDFPLHVISDLVLRLSAADGYPSRAAIPGQLSAWIQDDEPFCASLELVSLATGESWTGPEHCYGDELIDVLGVHEIDPSESLAMYCSGQPYTCEVDGGTWNPDACTPWDPPPGEDSGDGGSGGADGGGSGTDAGDGNSGDDNGAGSDGGGDGGGDSDSAPQDGGGFNDIGCACRAQPSSTGAGPWWLMLGLFGLGWRGRRRTAAARRR